MQALAKNWNLRYGFSVLIYLHHVTLQSKAWDIRYCTGELGMESGAIADDAITASSSYVPNVGPRNGRLKVERAGGGWCPKQQIEKGTREYLQVDLQEVHVITGVQTQGRYDRGRGQEYAEEYTLEYWRPGWDDWKEYERWDSKKIFRGNTDTFSVESHRLMPPVFASSVRILPYSVHRRTVCLRIELLGCFYDGGVVSYDAPEGSDPSQGLYDSSYDGLKSDGRLINGLGRLVDGEVGADNFRLDIGYGKGNGWVAWRNDSFSDGYVDLLFEFDVLRNFSAVHLYSNNFFTKGVQVFSKAKLAFSVGGLFYNGPTLSYTYMPDIALENSRNVSINLKGRIGRFIKMRLFFAERWIMISEVTFESVPISVNVTEEEVNQQAEKELIITSVADKTSDRFETIATKKDGDAYIEIVIGVLTAIMLLLLVVFMIILILNKRSKLQGSPTLFRNPFSMKINMKDLLMSFSPSNNNGNSSNNPTTPVSQGVPSSTLFEPFQSPLVDTYYTSKYATLRCSSNMEDQDDIPQVPPLPDDGASLHQIPIATTPSPHHYRSLQTTPALTAKSPKMINLNNYFPSVASDPPCRKRYHTAPREKHKIPPPIVCWNIAPSMGHVYSCREVELVPIPRYSLRPVEKLGACHAGEITLYETEGLEDIIPGVCRLVVVRTALPERAKSDAATGSLESLREVRFLAGLSDPNVCKVLGVCTAEQPPWTVVEYGEMGDLAQYLQFMVNKNGTVNCTKDQPLSVGSLIFMAIQIASGMKYLESKHVVHKDLAARNCLVGRGYIVKITDVAMCKPQYKKDYAEIGGRPPTPIRWLPWESILLDRYSCASSVWSFAVTLWEILNFACDKPFSNLSNEKVIQNTEHMYYGGELQIPLNKPTICPPDVYELMCECWKRDDTERPTFKQIYSFLCHINNGYTPRD